MRKEKIININEALKDEAFLQILQISDENDVIVEFGNIFPTLTQVAQPKYVRDSVLTISVENSVWRNELNLQRKIMIEKINKYFNKKIIKSIRFK